MKENREFVRYDKEMKIEYSIIGDNITNKKNGKICNISLGGIYMVTEQLVDQDTPLDLVFSFVKDDELIILKKTGTVLRAGTVVSDLAVNKKYSLKPEEGGFFAVVRFSEPFAELSFMLN